MKNSFVVVRDGNSMIVNELAWIVKLPVVIRAGNCKDVNWELLKIKKVPTVLRAGNWIFIIEVKKTVKFPL